MSSNKTVRLTLEAQQGGGRGGNKHGIGSSTKRSNRKSLKTLTISNWTFGYLMHTKEWQTINWRIQCDKVNILYTINFLSQGGRLHEGIMLSWIFETHKTCSNRTKSFLIVNPIHRLFFTNNQKFKQPSWKSLIC